MTKTLAFISIRLLQQFTVWCKKTACWGSCRQFRMPQLVLRRRLGSLTIWRRFCVNLTGCLCASDRLQTVGDSFQVPAWTGASIPYLTDDYVPVTSLESWRHVLSAESGCLAVTQSNTTLGARSFAVAGANGTVFRLTYYFTHSHYRHLDRGWSITCSWAMSASEDLLSCAM